MDPYRCAVSGVFNACLLLLGWKAPFDDGNPYQASATQIGFGTFGPPHIKEDTRLVDLIDPFTGNPVNPVVAAPDGLSRLHGSG
jgi:hypothetical protein